MGLGGLPWLISSEILPAKFRGPGSSIVAFSNFLMSFIVAKTFIDMQRLMTHAGVFWFYSSICFAGILFGLFFLPETKDKTSNQIEAYFKSDKKSWTSRFIFSQLSQPNCSNSPTYSRPRKSWEEQLYSSPQRGRIGLVVCIITLILFYCIFLIKYTVLTSSLRVWIDTSIKGCVVIFCSMCDDL